MWLLGWCCMKELLSTVLGSVFADYVLSALFLCEPLWIIISHCGRHPNNSNGGARARLH